MGPSIMFTFNKIHSLAFTYQFRTGVSLNNLLAEAARYGFTEFNDAALHSNDPKQFHATDFEFNAMVWQEYGATYGTVFHNKNRHLLKGAATVKYLAGVMGAYVTDPDIYFNVAAPFNKCLFLLWKTVP